MISQRPVIFGERETFDGLIAYTLDMENSFDIPHATTQFGTEPREADNSVEEMLWRHRELLAFLESQKMGSLGNPDPIVLDGTFTIEPGESIMVTSNPCPELIYKPHTWENGVGTQLWLDTLDTRPWWAVRLY